MLISLIMPYYENREMLIRQFVNWASWPEAVKKQFELIIVDDGSPISPAIDVPRPETLPPISIYRIMEDRLWHQHAARNLGAKMARARWMLLTDMDHMLDAENAAALLDEIGQLDPDTAYFLHRIEADTGLPTLSDAAQHKPHPNSFVMTYGLYWRVGGYDEDYCGIYGTDGLFKERLFKLAGKGFLDGVALIRFWRDIVPDASTRDMPRKEGRDPGAKKAVALAKAESGDPHRITVLNFPWRRLL